MNTLTRRFDLLRYPLIVLVVFIHADNRELQVGGTKIILHPEGPLAQWIRFMLSQELARVAVPLMFAMAGYLFFLGFDGSWAALRKKWQSRVASLLVPYLAWGFLHFAIQRAQGQWASADFWQVWDAVLGITRPPMVFHLWFVRDLIFMVLCAPLIFWGLRCCQWATVMAPLAIYVSGWWPLPRPGIVGIALFTLGAWLGSIRWQGDLLDRKPWLWVVTYAALLVGVGWEQGHYWSESLNRISLLVGCGAFLAIAGWAVRRNGVWVGKIEALAASSFFLYAAHEPLQRLLRSLLFRFIPAGFDPGCHLLYWVPAIIVAVGLTIFYFQMFCHLAWLRRIFAGGR